MALSKITNTGIDNITVNSSGSVGIGTSSPSDALTVSTSAVNGGVTVSGSTDPQYFLNSSGGNQARFKISDASSMIQTGSWTNIAVGFYTNGTERMRIDGATGNVLVGTTSNIFNSRQITRFESSGVVIGHTFWNGGVAGQKFTQFINSGGGLIGSITQSGASSTSYNTSSDYRLKENVTADWDATTRLKQLNPVRFNFISDADTTIDGFLAHEVQDIIPEAISGTKDAMRDEEYEVTPAVLDEDGNEVTPAVMGTRSVPDYQGIDQSKLVPLLVKTIQELEARIAALENV